MKKIINKLIRFYQKTAPARIRQSCRFEPSCSEYMILAIEKYGVFSGVSKGLNRLGRCKIPNGGIDNP
ncbi:MAG: membrane protein insertion efficiency factor YidD [Cytophagales bacterium]